MISPSFNLRGLLNRQLGRQSWLRAGALMLAVVLVMTSVSHDAEARRRRRAKKKKGPVINEKVLYERIGGVKTMGEIVDEWVRLTLADPRIASKFAATTAKPEKLQRLRKQLGDQMCELADGPCQYKGADMKKVHAGMNLGEVEFVAFAENLFKSLQKYGVPEREKNELLGRVGALRADLGLQELPQGGQEGASGASSASAAD